MALYVLDVNKKVIKMKNDIEIINIGFEVCDYNKVWLIEGFKTDKTQIKLITPLDIDITRR